MVCFAGVCPSVDGLTNSPAVLTTLPGRLCCKRYKKDKADVSKPSNAMPSVCKIVLLCPAAMVDGNLKVTFSGPGLGKGPCLLSLKFAAACAEPSLQDSILLCIDLPGCLFGTCLVLFCINRE